MTFLMFLVTFLFTIILTLTGLVMVGLYSSYGFIDAVVTLFTNTIYDYGVTSLFVRVEMNIEK